MADIPSGEKLLYQVMDKVLEIVTAGPSTGTQGELSPEQQGSNRLKNTNTVVQLALPGIPLYADDFKNMFHPGNTSGDEARTALFSLLVDAIPTAGTLKYVQTPRRVSLAYKAIVNGANAPEPQVTPDLQAKIDKANKLLYRANNKPTADFTDYRKRHEALDEAQDGLRRIAKVAADQASQYMVDFAPDFLKMPEAEQKKIIALYARKAQDYFSDAYPAAKRAVQHAREDLIDARMKRVEDALTFIYTNGNAFSGQLLRAMKDQVNNDDMYYTDRALKVPVMLSFPSSTSFANPSNESGWMSISCNTDALDLSQSQSERRTKVGGGGLWSLFFCGAGVDDSESTQTLDVNSKSFKLSFDLAVINILRPWMDATLFSEHVVWNAGRDMAAGKVSTGSFEKQTDSELLPFIPTQMLVARNVKIIADWTDEHQKWVKKHLDVNGHIGWGPFSVSTSHAQDNATFTKQVREGGLALELSGIQCIGFVSWIPPRSAPLDGTAKDAPYVPPGKAEQEQQQAAAKKAVAVLATAPKQRAPVA